MGQSSRIGRTVVLYGVAVIGALGTLYASRVIAPPLAVISMLSLFFANGQYLFGSWFALHRNADLQPGTGVTTLGIATLVSLSVLLCTRHGLPSGLKAMGSQWNELWNLLFSVIVLGAAAVLAIACVRYAINHVGRRK